VLLIFFPNKISASTLYFSPSSGNFSKGSTLNVNIYTNTEGENINAVQANFTYPSDKLQFINISTGGSVLTVIAEKQGGSGLVKIAGGSYTPFSGTKFIASVSFKVLSESGSAVLEFTQDSAVVKSSDNQNSLSKTSKASFTLSQEKPEVIKEEEEVKEEEPRIENVKIVNLGKNFARVVWQTNIPTTSVVEFGLSNQYGLLASDDKLVTDHSLELPSAFLLPGTTYHYKVSGRTESGKLVESQDLMFTTKGFMVKIKVVDEKGKPIQGAEVTLSSSLKKGITNSDGEVQFENVSLGFHGVLASHKGATAYKEIFVQDLDTPQSFDLSLSGSNLLPNLRLLYLAAGVSIFILFVGMIVGYTLSSRRRKTIIVDQEIKLNQLSQKGSENDIIEKERNL